MISMFPRHQSASFRWSPFTTFDVVGANVYFCRVERNEHLRYRNTTQRVSGFRLRHARHMQRVLRRHQLAFVKK